MSSRVERLRESLQEPLLVSAPANVRYLTGFVSSNAALLVEPEQTLLFSDFRYAETGRAVEGVEFVQTHRNLYLDLAERLSGPIGFEGDAVTYTQYARLHHGGLELVARHGLVEALRAVKDEGELDTIRAAGAATSQGFDRLADEKFVGRTERDVAWRLVELFREAGAAAPAFEIIVASGPNGARPHARASDRVIGAGETVVIDAAAQVDGYCSDCTRTFVTGPLPDRLQEAYDVCLAGQLAGLGAMKAGMSGADADAAARSVIADAGFGDEFGHGLGHGVGLEVHEAPRLSRESQDTLAAGHVVTVEPGIYLEGLGGIRIEDLVIITDGEPEILTTSPKELTTVS